MTLAGVIVNNESPADPRHPGFPPVANDLRHVRRLPQTCFRRKGHYHRSSPLSRGSLMQALRSHERNQRTINQDFDALVRRASRNVTTGRGPQSPSGMAVTTARSIHPMPMQSFNNGRRSRSRRRADAYNLVNGCAAYTRANSGGREVIEEYRFLIWSRHAA